MDSTAPSLGSAKLCMIPHRRRDSLKPSHASATASSENYSNRPRRILETGLPHSEESEHCGLRWRESWHWFCQGQARNPTTLLLSRLQQVRFTLGLQNGRRPARAIVAQSGRPFQCLPAGSLRVRPIPCHKRWLSRTEQPAGRRPSVCLCVPCGWLSDHSDHRGTQGKIPTLENP